MSDNATLAVVIMVLCIFFGGDPDLIDAITHWLMKD